MSERAYTLLHIKALDQSARKFTGIASTPELDRQNHSIDMSGVQFKNPIPLLMFHDQSSPVGTAKLRRTADNEIGFEASMPQVETPGRLKDRIDEAWDSIKAGLLTGVSIGFRPIGDAIEVTKGGLKFLKTEIFELSLVTIPANASASILTVKSLAATGPHLPCVAGSAPRTSMKQTTAEHIASLKATHGSRTIRMAELLDKAAEEGTTLDETAAKEYDGLALQVKSLESDIARLQTLQEAQAAAAAPVIIPAGAPRTPFVQVMKKELPKGTAFIRGVMAIAASKGNKMQAVEIAKQWKDTTPEVELWMKAAVTPGTTTDPLWAGALVQIQNLTSEFVELLRPATIIGKIAGLRRVPFNVQVPIQTAGGTYGWVGQGAPKPVTKLAFSTDSLGISKAAGIIVLTQELVRLSEPSAEAIVRADMIAGIAQFLDAQFIDPAIAAVANVSPASVTNGTVAITSTNAYADIHALASWFASNGIPLSGLALIMSETNAFTMSMIRDGNGNRLFPNMSATGGQAEGIQVITSQTAMTNVIMLAPQYILMADDGGVSIDVSTEASVQMDSAPMSPADATTVYRSFWQDNLVGIRAERFINWKRVKVAAVKYVSGAAYTPASLSALGGQSQQPPAETPAA
jgi:HK97 family phage major capsid protein/HK97 family phage prohead protease